jgi:hypothetical protein
MIVSHRDLQEKVSLKEEGSEISLENSILKATFDKGGKLVSLVHKPSRRY